MKNHTLSDERLSLNEVAKHLRVHVSTVHRWVSKSVRGQRLKSFLVGGRRYIAVSDLH